MNRVYIAGIGQTAVGEHWERSLENLSAEAVLAALHEADDPQVDALYAGNMGDAPRLIGEPFANTSIRIKSATLKRGE